MVGNQLAPVTSGPQGIVCSADDVVLRGFRGSVFVMETYVDTDQVPGDLVAEAVMKLVWEDASGSADTSRVVYLLENIISARMWGVDRLCLYTKGVEEVIELRFQGDDRSANRFLAGLGQAVPMYELGTKSGTFSVDSKRRIRRVKRSLVEMDDFVPQRMQPSAQRPQTIYLLQAFASFTAGLREAVDKVGLDRRLHPTPPPAKSPSETRSSRDEREISPPFPVSRSRKRGVPVSLSAWTTFLKKTQPIDSYSMRHAIFLGGMTPEARPEAWPYIAKVFDWDDPLSSRIAKENKLQEEYEELKARWTQFGDLLDKRDGAGSSPEGEGETPEDELLVTLVQHRSRIMKDVTRTDREVDLFKSNDAPALDAMRNVLTTYAVYDPEIGYCQGMSDILAPILYVFHRRNESLSFWTFATLMSKLERNFRVDQTGIHEQLALLRQLIQIRDQELAEYFEANDPNFFSCFRWILVMLKRELPFADVLRLWEVLWLEHLEEEFQIYIVVGLLLLHKENLLKLGGFDDLVRYVNEMSMRIDIERAIEDAVRLFKQVGKLQG